MIIPEELLVSLKNKHLLLDANVFIDSLDKPSLYTKLFNYFKDNQTTLATIDFVVAEIVRGASDINDYNKKEKIIKDITDTILPNIPSVNDHFYELIKKYKEDGKSLSITDFYLGCNLMLYGESLFLMTRSTTEFPERIFELVGVINLAFDRTLHAYGIYKFK